MTPLTLTRYAGNPILLPSLVNEWESDNVFNAAVVERDGLIVMLYRAQGLDRISRIGCAVSTDGVHFNRMKEPVFVPEEDYEQYGVEDPRVTYLDGWYYMLYTGFSPQGTRVALARSRNLIGWERMGVVLPGENNRTPRSFRARSTAAYVMFHRRMQTCGSRIRTTCCTGPTTRSSCSPRPGMWDGVRELAQAGHRSTPRRAG